MNSPTACKIKPDLENLHEMIRKLMIRVSALENENKRLKEENEENIKDLIKEKINRRK